MSGVFPSLSKFSTLLFIACFPHVVYILFFYNRSHLGNRVNLFHFSDSSIGIHIQT